MLRVLTIILGLFVISSSFAEARNVGNYYVSANRLNVRLAPNPKGNVVNVLKRNQEVEVFEVKNGWARVSKYYKDSVKRKRGEVARWVSVKYLSNTKYVNDPHKNNSKKVHKKR